MSSARIFKTGPALLMLLFVTAGLFTMHTLGHFTMPAAHGGEHPAMSAGPQPQAVPASHEPDMPMGSVVMCVAILCGLTLLVVAALLLRRLRVHGLAAQLRRHRVLDAVRGPPVMPIGLAIADLSVLRT
jgi:uncharacterized membrane protein YphA (DoxX/SURF4 family)